MFFFFITLPHLTYHYPCSLHVLTAVSILFPLFSLSAVFFFLFPFSPHSFSIFPYLHLYFFLPSLFPLFCPAFLLPNFLFLMFNFTFCYFLSCTLLPFFNIVIFLLPFASYCSFFLAAKCIHAFFTFYSFLPHISFYISLSLSVLLCICYFLPVSRFLSILG